VTLSSHREAPEISKDPVADSTDLYAFVSPDRPGYVTLIANYLPLEGPAGGPNFYEFGDDVLYAIHIDNNGDGRADVTYELGFKTDVLASTFLYNVGPIESLDSPNWNRQQHYWIARTDKGGRKVLRTGLKCPPCNIGPLSTPNYAKLVGQAVHSLPGNRTVFAGQRAEGFYVDLGAIFDLGDLRPFEQLHNTFGIPGLSLKAAPGVNTTRFLNVHSIAIQVPIADLTADGRRPSSPTAKGAVVGVWTTASRRKARVLRSGESPVVESGPWVQVSRLGNPLVNEVLIPMDQKDYWNSEPPSSDSQFAQYVAHPQLAGLLNVLYPGVFPNLAAYSKKREDLLAVFHTGIPAGIVPNFATYSGSVQADMLRVNLAIPPAKSPNRLGVLGGDLAGFPNGRRVFDDVVTIEVRALAGATIPLVDPSFKPDGAASLVTDGLDGSDLQYLSRFPYLGTPYSGYDEPGVA
jgi:hypothetical protein